MYYKNYYYCRNIR